MMKMRLCFACGRNCWHNSLAKKPAEEQGWRCTFCGYPLGTGPKAARMERLHKAQLAKVGRHG